MTKPSPWLPADGKILLAGCAENKQRNTDFAVTRLLALTNTASPTLPGAGFMPRPLTPADLYFEISNESRPQLIRGSRNADRCHRGGVALAPF